MNIDELVTPSVLAFARARKEQLLSEAIPNEESCKQCGRLDELELIIKLCIGLQHQLNLIQKALE